MKKAVLITIGDEILSGNTVDTNSNFIAQKLKDIGIPVIQIFTISDEADNIKKTLKSALELADIVITTGGIGPTKDDKTKKALADFYNDELIFDEESFEHLKKLLESRGRLEILERNREQAMVLSKAKIFQNHYGTAPCMMVEENKKIVFCLPGIPFEVKPLIKNQIIPYLKEKFQLYHLLSRVISVVGIPESILADLLENWENALPQNTSLSYLPIGTRIKLRLTAKGTDLKTLETLLENEIQKLFPIIGHNIIATQEDDIEQILHHILTKKHLSISTSESCTGGELSRLITSVSGSSAYFVGGIVTYQTSKKTEFLQVSKQTIQEKTVVSEKVALEMAKGCQNLFRTDISISTTGVAGPNTDEDNTEIGTVYFAIRFKEKEYVFKLFLPHMERNDFIKFVSQKALENLVKILVNED